MYINHLTLITGHNARTSRADVDDDVLALVAPWLLSIVNAGQKSPLPVPALSHFSAVAYVQDGGLVVTVYGSSGPHLPGQPANSDIPLVTLMDTGTDKMRQRPASATAPRHGNVPDLQPQRATVHRLRIQGHVGPHNDRLGRPRQRTIPFPRPSRKGDHKNGRRRPPRRRHIRTCGCPNGEKGL